MTSEGTTTQAREEAQRVAGTAGEEARHLTEQAKSEARSLAEDARSRAREMAGDTGRRLKDEADGQMTRAASAMRDMSGDLRAMSEAEAASGEGMPIQFARSAADWMEQTATRLERDGVDGLISDAERFARRNPAAFMAVAAGAGLLVGRLVRNAPKGEMSGNGSGEQRYGRPPTQRTGTGTGTAGGDIGAPPVTRTAPTTPPATTAPTTPPARPLQGGAPGTNQPDLGGGRTP